MRPETEAMLMATFKNDILNLQELIGRDLSHWIETE